MLCSLQTPIGLEFESAKGVIESLSNVLEDVAHAPVPATPVVSEVAAAAPVTIINRKTYAVRLSCRLHFINPQLADAFAQLFLSGDILVGCHALRR